MKYFLISCALVAGFAVQAQEYPEQVTHFPGDLSNDSVVGTNDLMLLLSLWGIDYAELIPESPCSWATAIDYEGYEYELVAIGDQCWFAENLRTEHYANGDAIPGNLSDSEWESTTSGAQAVYGEGSSQVYGGSDDEEANLATYGRLYNRYAVDDSRGLCPSGWHVPTDGEWTELTDFLGGLSVAGGAMKSSLSDLPAWDGSNSSGFSALPGGYRQAQSGNFGAGHSASNWWVGAHYWMSHAWYRGVASGINTLMIFNNSLMSWGNSVRCVQD